jgi:hypothetical protein
LSKHKYGKKTKYVPEEAQGDDGRVLKRRSLGLNSPHAIDIEMLKHPEDILR